jgi:hypothetical protein
MKLEAITLKRSTEYSENWVQKQIAEDPSILGLGDLVLKDKERTQRNAGRLDLLLQDPDTLKRYEVEVQLGATDESHIVRTIEYWDIEKRRYPQYEHCAVIVAEDITARFLNVIHLFNGAIPLIALKMTAYKVGNECALTFVKVLDEISFGLVDEDETTSEPTDRSYWEKRTRKDILGLADNILKLVRDVAPTSNPTYKSQYIGLDVGGSPMNFVSLIPRKKFLIVSLKLSQSAEIDQQLQEADFETMTYDTAFRYYRLRVESVMDDKQKEVLLDLMRQAYAGFRS